MFYNEHLFYLLCSKKLFIFGKNFVPEIWIQNGPKIGFFNYFEKLVNIFCLKCSYTESDIDVYLSIQTPYLRKFISGVVPGKALDQLYYSILWSDISLNRISWSHWLLVFGPITRQMGQLVQNSRTRRKYTF